MKRKSWSKKEACLHTMVTYSHMKKKTLLSILQCHAIHGCINGETYLAGLISFRQFDIFLI